MAHVGRAELAIDIAQEENEMQTALGDVYPGLSPEPGMLSICPLCNSRIRLYFIHFNKKFLMCENVQCEYPFGYEDLQFVKEDTECDSDEEIASIWSRTSTQGSSATTSTATGSNYTTGSTLVNYEIEQINAALYSDDASICTTSSFDSNFEMLARKKVSKVEEKEIKDNLNEIENLTIVLQNETKWFRKSIKDPKRLRKLKNLGVMSGKPLLRPREEKLLKEDQPNSCNIGTGEFKIDINPGIDNTVSSIQIKILNGTNNWSNCLKSPDEEAT